MGTIYRNGVPFVGSGGAGGVEMTQEEYDDLPTSEKMNGAIYFITDGDVSYPSASQMRYDNTESQIPATTVQGAIDENRIEINSLKNGLNNSLTFTPASGVSVTNKSIGAFNGMAFGSMEVQLTASANTWTQLGRLSKQTTNAAIMPCIRTGNGTHAGMVKIEGNGMSLYPTQSLSGNAVAFTFAFKTSD